MKRNQASVILLAGLLTTSGCAVAVLGMGAAAGTGAAYVTGKDTRTYDSEYHQTAQACMETLTSLKIPVSQTSADELKTTIQARRADETPVHIEVVRSREPRRSEVGVRTGVVGISEWRPPTKFTMRSKSVLHVKTRNRQKRSVPPKALWMSPNTRLRFIQAGPGRKTEALSSIPLPEERLLRSPYTSCAIRTSCSPSETAKLDQVAETISQQPEARLTLNGYTDSVGSSRLQLNDSRKSCILRQALSRSKRDQSASDYRCRKRCQGLCRQQRQRRGANIEQAS